MSNKTTNLLANFELGGGGGERGEAGLNRYSLHLKDTSLFLNIFTLLSRKVNYNTGNVIGIISTGNVFVKTLRQLQDSLRSRDVNLSKNNDFD